MNLEFPGQWTAFLSLLKYCAKLKMQENDKCPKVSVPCCLIISSYDKLSTFPYPNYLPICKEVKLENLSSFQILCSWCHIMDLAKKWGTGMKSDFKKTLSIYVYWCQRKKKSFQEDYITRMLWSPVVHVAFPYSLTFVMWKMKWKSRKGKYIL